MTVHGRSGLFLVIFVLLLTLSSFPSLAESNRDYVRGLYRELLNREPDPSGIHTWVGGLDSGKMSRKDVQKGIKNSEEYKKLHGNDTPAEPSKADKKPKNYLDSIGMQLKEFGGQVKQEFKDKFEELKNRTPSNGGPEGTSGGVAGNEVDFSGATPVTVHASGKSDNISISGGEGENRGSKTYDTDPMATGELNFETAGIKHQTTQCANGDWEYIFLSVYGENMGRFLLLHAGGGSRAIRYVLECPETKTMRMEIASDNLPDWHKWTVRWGNGELKVFLDGKQIGRTEAFNGKPNKFIVGGNKNSRRNFLGKWRCFYMNE